jgi:hypothetical protein
MSPSGSVVRKRIVALMMLPLALCVPPDLLAFAPLPNSVIILADGQGYSDVGKFGAEGFTMPKPDRVAEQSGVFRSLRVAQPNLSKKPSTNSSITGHASSARLVK